MLRKKESKNKRRAKLLQDVNKSLTLGKTLKTNHYIYRSRTTLPPKTKFSFKSTESDDSKEKEEENLSVVNLMQFETR